MILAILVVVILGGLVYWAVHKLAVAFGLPAPIVTLVDVLLVVACVLYLLQASGLLQRLAGAWPIP